MRLRLSSAATATLELALVVTKAVLWLLATTVAALARLVAVAIAAARGCCSLARLLGQSLLLATAILAGLLLGWPVPAGWSVPAGPAVPEETIGLEALENYAGHMLSDAVSPHLECRAVSA